MMKDRLLGFLFLLLFGNRTEAEDAKLYTLEELADDQTQSLNDLAENDNVKIYRHDEKSKHRGLYKFLDDNFEDKKGVIIYGYCGNMDAVKGVVDKMPEDWQIKMKEAYFSFLYAAKKLKDSDTGFVFVDLKDFSKIKPGRWRDFLFLVEISKKANNIKLNFPFYMEFENKGDRYSFKRVIPYGVDIVKKK